LAHTASLECRAVAREERSKGRITRRRGNKRKEGGRAPCQTKGGDLKNSPNWDVTTEAWQEAPTRWGDEAIGGREDPLGGEKKGGKTAKTLGSLSGKIGFTNE